MSFINFVFKVFKVAKETTTTDIDVARCFEEIGATLATAYSVNLQYSVNLLFNVFKFEIVVKITPLTE